jgi:uncharacterized membrane protein
MMEAKARAFGHPVHPMLIVLPLGLLVASVIFDTVFFLGDDRVFAQVAFWNIAGGIVGGLIAALFGVADWLAIPSHTRAKSVGLAHGVGNLGVMILFGIAWVLRLGVPDHAADTTSFVFSLAGLALGAVTGWLGGELVNRLGVGVHPGANLNAPSSLSRRPVETTGQPVWSGIERRATLRKREV